MSSGATLDRPFASPGDVVEIGLDPACHGSATFGSADADQAVTIVFTPQGGPRNVVILATDCGALEPARQACAALPTVASASCRQVNGPGDPTGLTVVDAQHLRFRFPDTDDALLAADDDITLAGPALIAVTSMGSLPCELTATGATCSTLTGALACVDTFRAQDGTPCGITPHETFPGFTALPPPNDYQAVCVDPVPPCLGTVNDLRVAVDAAGNALLPVDWRGILIDSDRLPIARLLRGTTSVEAFEGSGQPIHVPGASFLNSFSPEGRRLPPLFDPQSNPTDTAAATFFGSADAPHTILRLARRSAGFHRCAGGANDGLPCIAAADCAAGACSVAALCVGGTNDGMACDNDGTCPGGECGAGLFDFRTRLAGGVGPVVIRLGACIGGSATLQACTDDSECPGGQCGSFSVVALDPVPLDGLHQSTDSNAFVVAEAIVNQDLDGDGVVAGDVVLFGSRVTGVNQPIGPGGLPARAVARVRDGGFSFPALDVDGDTTAFVEQHAGPETELRIFRLGISDSLLSGQPVDMAPLVNHRALAISDGFVFYRVPEFTFGPPQFFRLSTGTVPDACPCPPISIGPAVSRGGFAVAFPIGRALDAQDTNGQPDVYVTGLSSFPARISVTPGGQAADNGVSGGRVGISADGRYVAYASRSTNLAPDDTDTIEDVFVHNGYAAAGTTVRVSIGPDGSPLGVDTHNPAISGDGRFVVFEAGPPTASTISTLYLHDRDSDGNGIFDEPGGRTTTLIAAGPSWGSLDAVLTPGGRFLAFDSDAPDLVANDTNLGRDVFVRDLTTGVTERVSVDSDGEQANADSFQPAISDDGRVIAFLSSATNLVAGDTNSATDVFVHDRATGRTERVNVLMRFQPPMDFPGGPASLSGDGRYVAYASNVPSLNIGAIIVHDRVGGSDQLLLPGSGPNGGIGGPALSHDGRQVVFVSPGSNIVPGDSNGDVDVFVALRGSGTDLTGNHSDRDVLLGRYDIANAAAILIHAANEVAVTGPTAAFLVPESADDADLNGDGDRSDEIVHYFDGGSTGNFGIAATHVAMSDSWIAALAPETGNGVDLNGDGDKTDTLAMVRRKDFFASWHALGPADAVDLSGDLVALTFPEQAQGQDITGDGDTSDRVLYVLRADGGPVPPGTPGRPAQDFVVGGVTGAELVAFRTAEADEQADLNGDGDMDDSVLRVWDVANGRLVDPHLAVTPCNFEACDPRLPYRVGRDTVTFLTLEEDQQQDLNGDGDMEDLVLEVLNVRLGANYVLAAVSTGICTGSARACATDRDCHGGTCFVPPGGCIDDLGSSCVPEDGCGAGNFCEPILGSPGQGRCKRLTGSCAVDADCAAPAVCSDAGQAFQRLASPFTKPNMHGHVLPSSGHCVEDTGTACSGTCAAGLFCGPGGTCVREHGPCRKNADCRAGACVPDVVMATANDSDDDEIPDAFDNCPRVANVEQEDANGNGVGDACEVGCPDVPKLGCKLPLPFGTSFLKIADKPNPKGDTVQWQWSKGALTAPGELGDPRSVTSYALCVWDRIAGVPRLVVGTGVPGGLFCDGRPCWTQTRTGFRFKSKTNALAKATLSAGPAGKAKVKVKAKGVRLTMPALPLAQDPTITVQVLNSAGTCWEASYSTAKSNTTSVFKAKSE